MKKVIFILFLSFISLFTYSQDKPLTELKALYQTNKYDQIITDHSSKASGYSARALYYIGMAYYMKTDDNNCLKFMKLSIEKDKTDPDAHFITGMTLNYLGQFEKAINSFQSAIKLNTESSDFYSGLGDSYFSLKQFDKAIIAYKEATKKENAIDRPFIMLPQAYTGLNEKENALKYFYIARDKIAKTTNSYITVLYNIGLFELLNKDYDKAELALKELIDLEPKDYHSYSKLIQVYYGKKEYAKTDTYRKKLYEAYSKGELSNNLKDKFCFDQFNWNDKLILVFERFETSQGKLYYKHIFYVTGESGKTEFTIQTENSPVSEEMSGPKYAIGMDKDGTHSTFGFIEENFKYEDLKAIVVQILEDELKASATSTKK